MFFFYGNQLGHRLVQNLPPWTTRERGVYRRTGNHNRDICRALRRGLFRHARFGVSLEVRRMVRRLIGVLQLGLGSINLKGTVSEVSFIRNFRANHLGGNLRPGAEA